MNINMLKLDENVMIKFSDMKMEREPRFVGILTPFRIKSQICSQISSGVKESESKSDNN